MYSPETIIETFFMGDDLKRMFHYFCETSIGHVLDPISETICLMSTSPLQLTITEIGVTFFKDKHTHVYPFSMMNDRQKEYIKNIIRDVLTHQRSEREAFASGTHTLQFVGTSQRNHTPQELVNTDASIPKSSPVTLHGIQMGGGFVMQVNPPDKKKVLLDIEAVMRAFCEFVFNSKIHTDQWTRQTICTIIVQRVCSAIYLPNSIQQRVFSLISELVGPTHEKDSPPVTHDAGTIKVQ